MLCEKAVRQPVNGSRRRWFADDDLELIVWLDADQRIKGFQLCYDCVGTERALTWTRDQGYSHDRVDDGEDDPTQNDSPILVPAGAFARDRVARLLEEHSGNVPENVRGFVLEKVRKYHA